MAVVAGAARLARNIDVVTGQRENGTANIATDKLKT